MPISVKNSHRLFAGRGDFFSPPGEAAQSSPLGIDGEATAVRARKDCWASALLAPGWGRHGASPKPERGFGTGH